MKVGEYQTLQVDRITDPGAFLTDGKTDVLLPTKYMPSNLKKGDQLHLFVYRDSEDRIICTTQSPYALINEFAYLKVKDINNIGAFLDWGIDKDLLVPFREQKNNLCKGQWSLVYLFLDEKTDRLVATTKIARYFKTKITVEEGDEVDLLITNTTALGVNVVINNSHRGLIYESELFHDVLEGDRLKGYIKTIREDSKIDVSLRKKGFENLEIGTLQILNKLKSVKGFLPLHDKSDPDDIQSLLQMSKKNFKRSVGILYKKKLVQIEKGGIRLV